MRYRKGGTCQKNAHAARRNVCAIVRAVYVLCTFCFLPLVLLVLRNSLICSHACFTLTFCSFTFCFIPRIKHLLNEKWYTLIDGNLPAQIYTKPEYRDSVYQALQGLNHVRVWKKEDIPAYLNYGSNPRVGDIIVLPDLGWLVEEGNKTLPGAHGFDPTYDDMQVMFRACGPDFKKRYEAPKFRNVSIYSLLARLLHITPEKTDGNLSEVESMLIQ